MKRILSLLLICSCSFTFLFAQDWSAVEIKTEKLSDNVYVLFGRGGNVGLCVGEDGVFMIDDQYAPLSEKIVAAIAEITDKPVKFLLNTHWHGDHTGGNENFGKKGAVLVAHENVRKRLSTDQFMQAFSRNVEAKPDSFWPEVTFKKDVTFHMNGEEIIAFHVHNAHTDGDAIVYFPKSNVVHMGDTYFRERFPFFDVSSGGSVNGMINAANKVLFLANEDTKIIPGHGIVSNKVELQKYRDVLMALRDRVQGAIDDGKSFEEIIAAKLSTSFEGWGEMFINYDKIVDLIYTDLSREK